MEILFRSGLTSLARNRIVLSGEALVLTFHRVLTDSAFQSTNSPAGMVVRRQTFVDLLTWLGREAEFVSLSDLPKHSARLKVSLTFDDGWSDNFDVCLTVLRQRSIPACIFICPGMVGRRMPFWPEQAIVGLRRVKATPSCSEKAMKLFEALEMNPLHLSETTLLQYLKQHPESRAMLLSALGSAEALNGTDIDSTMTWAELRHLAQGNVEIGAHTASHQILTELNAKEQTAELLRCNAQMEAELKVAPRFFAYPNGSWDEDSKRMVASCYERALINEPGTWSADTDVHLIPRTNLNENRLTGFNGRFSVAAAHYNLYWLPYLS